jgi:hypothetical protein
MFVQRCVQIFDSVKVITKPGNYKFTCYFAGKLTFDKINEETEKKWSDGINEFESLHPELTLGTINRSWLSITRRYLVRRIYEQVKKQAKV